MKRTLASILAMILMITSIPCAFAASKTDAGYYALITLLSESLGYPAESVDDSDVFSRMDTTSFNTKKASNLALFDPENKTVTVFGKHEGKNAKMSIWQELDKEVLSEAGFIVLSNYKDINSKSAERFAFAIWDSANALYIDTVAEANSGLKKYGRLFGAGGDTAAAAAQTEKPASAPANQAQNSGTTSASASAGSSGNKKQNQELQRIYEYSYSLFIGMRTYSEGQYKAGYDFVPREYVLFSTDDWGGYFSLSSDANGDQIIANELFDINSIITVKKGEYIELSDCIAINAEDFYSSYRIDPKHDGIMLKVGYDIMPGEYKLIAQSGEYGYYCIYNDSRQINIKANNLFKNSAWITLKAGQYVVLSRCHIQ